jgi:molybdopterin-guanine dinucleotide biosynthesis protein A
MFEALTGIILAGGSSRRFGSNKALMPWGRGNLIERVIDILKPLCPDILVMVKNPGDFRFLRTRGFPVLKDMMKKTYPLGGIYSGLSHVKTDSAFVCGCDMPYIQPDLIEALWKAGEGFDAVIPVWSDKPQTLCGIYTINCLSAIGEMLEEDNFKIYELYSRVRTRFLRESEVKDVDPRGLSFVDVDTIRDYENARTIENMETGNEAG